MVVTTHKVVSLIFTIRINAEDGKLIEDIDANHPIQYIHGTGFILPKFEANIEGLADGEEFNFKLNCEDAYGKRRDDMVIEFEKSAFDNLPMDLDAPSSIGKPVTMVNQDGVRMQGTIVKVSESNVTLDFNHPMADYDLYVAGRVVGIRDATDMEIEHGHVHCKDDGCGCGCDGGGCNDDYISDVEDGCGCGCGCH